MSLNGVCIRRIRTICYNLVSLCVSVCDWCVAFSRPNPSLQWAHKDPDGERGWVRFTSFCFRTRLPAKVIQFPLMRSIRVPCSKTERARATPRPFLPSTAHGAASGGCVCVHAWRWCTLPWLCAGLPFFLVPHLPRLALRTCAYRATFTLLFSTRIQIPPRARGDKTGKHLLRTCRGSPVWG